MIVGSISEPQTAPEQTTQEQIEKLESEIAAEELIKKAEERRDSQEMEKDGVINPDVSQLSQFCQDSCEALYPHSAQDMGYTECVLNCVLG